MIHGPEEREKKNKTRKSACDCAKAQPFIIYKPASLRSLFPRPDVATVSHFAVFVDVDPDVQLQDGQAAARGQRRKAVIRDISGIDH